MVIPVNTDKPITTDADRTTPSNQRMSTEQRVDKQSTAEPQATAQTETGLDVDSARQLYQLENNKPGTVGPSIETAEQAKNLLDQVLEQFAATPKQAFNTQSAASNPLIANLLEAAPG